MRGAVLAAVLVGLLVRPVSATPADEAPADEAPADEAPRVVYTEQLAGGPLASLEVALLPIDSDVVTFVTVREREPLPPGARIDVRLRPQGRGWTEEALVRREDGTWSAGLPLPAVEYGALSVTVTADRETLQQIGRPGRSLRRVPLSPDAERLDLPVTSADSPWPVLDTPGRGVIERVRVGLYVADPVGLGLTVLVDLTEDTRDEVELVVDWNPPGLPSSPLRLHRVGPRQWMGEILPTPAGESHLIIQAFYGREEAGRLGSADQPVRFSTHLGVVEAPEIPGVADPEAPAPEQVDGFHVVYREEVAAGPIESVVIGARAAGRRVEVLSRVTMRPGLELPPHQVAVELNGQRSPWRTVRLTPDADGRWRGVMTLPHPGWGYMTAHVLTEDRYVQSLGTRVRAARAVEFSPLAARQHLAPTSVDAPRILHRASGEGLIDEVEVGVFMANADGLGLRFRVRLTEEPPAGAAVELDWNPPGAPWAPLRLVEVEPLLYEAVARPANPGPTYFTTRVWRAADVLGRVGTPAKPRRVDVELLPE